MNDYGKVNLTLKEYMDERNISRRKLSILTNTKYDVISRYYKNENIERVSVDILAKICHVLNCDISDIMKYDKK